jgi:hypothetical protein
MYSPLTPEGGSSSASAPFVSSHNYQAAYNPEFIGDGVYVGGGSGQFGSVSLLPRPLLPCA